MNDIVMANDPPFSLWRLEIKDLEGRVFEIRDGNDPVARFGDIAIALSNYEALTKGVYED